jgi:hypothetical protein
MRYRHKLVLIGWMDEGDNAPAPPSAPLDHPCSIGPQSGAASADPDVYREPGMPIEARSR